MIKPTDLSMVSVVEKKRLKYDMEFKSLEENIDYALLKKEEIILKYGYAWIKIHDNDNTSGALDDVLKKYEANGWHIKKQRTSCALFVDIKFALTHIDLNPTITP